MAIKFWALALLGAVASPAACAPHEPNGAPENWLYTSSINATVLGFLDRPDIVGVQALYGWRALEPEKDVYDFSSIKSDLRRVKSKGKKLWVQLQDRTFNISNDAVPPYMHTPLYDNGSVHTCDGSNCSVVFEADGWMAIQWNRHVRTRFQALIGALARELDGDIYGINLPETSIAVEVNKANYSDEGYFEGELDNAGFAARVFRRTFVVQYVNFWPGDWANDTGAFTRSFNYYAEHGVGVGGPDLIPHKKTQEDNAYPFIYNYRNKLPITVIAVQEPDLKANKTDAGDKSTKEDFVEYATNNLAIKIIFWALSSPWLRM